MFELYIVSNGGFKDNAAIEFKAIHQQEIIA